MYFTHSDHSIWSTYEITSMQTPPSPFFSSIRLVGQNPNSEIKSNSYLLCFCTWTAKRYWRKTHNHAVVNIASVHQYLLLLFYLVTCVSPYPSLERCIQWTESRSDGMSLWGWVSEKPVSPSRSLFPALSTLEAMCLNEGVTRWWYLHQLGIGR